MYSKFPGALQHQALVKYMSGLDVGVILTLGGEVTARVNLPPKLFQGTGASLSPETPLQPHTVYSVPAELAIAVREQEPQVPPRLQLQGLLLSEEGQLPQKTHLVELVRTCHAALDT